MKISIASDHGGYELKSRMQEYLIGKGFDVIDRGPNSTQSVDYPDYAKIVSNDVANKNAEFGILICTSGIGMSIAANKVKGVRAALCHNVDSSKFSRLHNDANVICMGAKYVETELAKIMLDTFLTTPFEGGRHCCRVQKFE